MASDKVDHIRFANVAFDYRDSGIPYSKLDCQAFVERVLSDCGVSKNWKGSNDMWRNALSWKGTPDECIERWGEIPAGAWLFTLAFDGGEVQRGYHDNEGNAKHVGIYTGLGLGAMHSTAGGVQECKYPDSKRWNRVGLCKYIDYGESAGAVMQELCKVAKCLANATQDLLTISNTLCELIERMNDQNAVQ